MEDVDDDDDLFVDVAGLQEDTDHTESESPHNTRFKGEMPAIDESSCGNKAGSII